MYIIQESLGAVGISQDCISSFYPLSPNAANEVNQSFRFAVRLQVVPSAGKCGFGSASAIG